MYLFYVFFMYSFLCILYVFFLCISYLFLNGFITSADAVSCHGSGVQDHGHELIIMHTVNFRLLVPSIVVKQKFKLTNQIQAIPKRHRV